MGHKTQYGLFPSKIALALKEVCYKVSTFFVCKLSATKLT